MRLEFHDGEVGNSLCARCEVDYAYQAEMHVQESAERVNLVRWELFDDEGLICVWEREAGSTKFPDITKRSPRFDGEWQKGPNEVAVN